ncbi:MAG: ATP-binding cassette domain-containing protein [Bacteroidetes bacterium]|nr:ATP-binding cassette domain-containing protein [Bacteroidota bacterium]
MAIQTKQLVPRFLEKEKVERSGIWNKEFVCNKGEKIQIIAPSGSGKTSLIHFLYGLRNDYDGTITINNTNIQSLSAEAFASIRSNQVSIIFQDLRLFADHTVWQNIEIKRSLNPFHSAETIKTMAERLGISNKLQKQVRLCSYGEQQRIAIIRALQQPFDFILMDEPYSHLDENNRKIATALIEEEAAKRNAGILLADLKRVEYFNADRIVQL